MGFFGEQKAGVLWKGAFSWEVSKEPSSWAPWWLSPFSGSPGVGSLVRSLAGGDRAAAAPPLASPKPTDDFHGELASVSN